MKTIASKTIAFNGKFFGAAPTGVHRVAEQLVAATDALIAGQAGNDVDYAVSDYDGIINVVTGLPGNQGISCGDELLGNPVHARRRCPEELAVERYRLRCDRFHSFPARSRVNILRTKSQKPIRLPLKRSRRSPQSAGAILRTMSLATLRRTTQFL